MRFLNSIGDAVLSLSPPELIGAILIALVMAAAISGLYTLARRKMADASMLMICLVLLACVASMTLAAGYMRYSQGRGRPVVAASRPAEPRGSRRGPGLELHLAARIMAIADTNKDGSLSSEEAADAAGRFAQSSGATGEKSLDAQAVAEALRVALFPPLRPNRPSPAPEPSGALPGVVVTPRPVPPVD